MTSFGGLVVLFMALVAIRIALSILSPSTKTNPEMQRFKRTLVARSRFWARAWSLFSSNQVVRIDAKAGFITIESQRFWILRREESFSTKAVQWVDFRYVGNVSLQRDMETYRAVLVLKKNKRVPLFEFTGHKDAGWLVNARNYNAVSGTYTGDAALIQDQHMDALWFVRTLCAILDVPMREPMPDEPRPAKDDK